MRLGLLLLLAATAACQGGRHQRGERHLIGEISVGIPSGGNLLWAGDKADAPNVGAAVAVEGFVRDRVALLGTLYPYRYYDQNDGPAHAQELQFGVRYFPPLEFELGKLPMAVFLDVSVGVIQSSRSIPAGGTHTNITQESGIGLEARLSETSSLLFGYHQRHISNGGGNAPDNPGFNDHQIFVAFTRRW